jgi:nicotinate-nucleotide--dimethylbenzimidazole phosphoribosyltransferase
VLRHVEPRAGLRVERQAVRPDGSANIAVEPAMSEGELEHCLQIGAAAAEQARADGIDLLVLGEMGIGNSTAASAVVARVLGLDAETVVGPGAGLDEAGILDKKHVLERTLLRSRQHELTPLGVLADVGGLELAALAGCATRAAELRIPVLLDGFIVGAAALAAARHAPPLPDFLIATSCSAEPAHRIVLDALGAGTPLLDLGLRLGEATAAALALPLIQAACRLLTDMAGLHEVIETARAVENE